MHRGGGQSNYRLQILLAYKLQIYVDDIPRQCRELQLFPVQSRAAHAKIVSIDPAPALALPGVVAWIAAKNVPGRNAWSIGGLPDEAFVRYHNLKNSFSYLLKAS